MVSTIDEIKQSWSEDDQIFKSNEPLLENANINGTRMQRYWLFISLSDDEVISNMDNYVGSFKNQEALMYCFNYLETYFKNINWYQIIDSNNYQKTMNYLEFSVYSEFVNDFKRSNRIYITKKCNRYILFDHKSNAMDSYIGSFNSMECMNQFEQILYKNNIQYSCFDTLNYELSLEYLQMGYTPIVYEARNLYP